MMTLFKASLLALYAGALASLFFVLPADAGPLLRRLTLLVLGAHVLETVFVLRILRRDPRGLAASVFSCLLYGLFHWLPLMRSSPAAAPEKGR